MTTLDELSSTYTLFEPLVTHKFLFKALSSKTTISSWLLQRKQIIATFMRLMFHCPLVK